MSRVYCFDQYFKGLSDRTQDEIYFFFLIELEKTNFRLMMNSTGQAIPLLDDLTSPIGILGSMASLWVASLEQDNCGEKLKFSYVSTV